MATQIFGEVNTAMVTPMTEDRELDREAIIRIAEHLTRPGANDGLIVNGTTGESATTSDAEKAMALEAVVESVGDRVNVVAGVGSADTRHSIELAKQAEALGADGLLVVTPYYSKPSQQGILEHFLAVADATALPVMLYDIPGRSGVALSRDTIARASNHPNIRAIKDAKGDLEMASWVVRNTDLELYSGEDALNLPFLSIGAVGFVSVVGHFVADRLRTMKDAFDSGDHDLARNVHGDVLPLVEAIFTHPGAVSTKAGLALSGLSTDTVRLPYSRLNNKQVQELGEALRELELARV